MMDNRIIGIYTWMLRVMPKNKEFRWEDNTHGTWFTSSCISLDIKTAEGKPITPWRGPIING